MCTGTNKEGRERRRVTHQELIDLHMACNPEHYNSGDKKERDRRENRLSTKFKTAIAEAITTTELKTLGALVDASDPGNPVVVCPKALESYLSNRLRHFTACEAKAARLAEARTPAPRLAEAH